MSFNATKKLIDIVDWIIKKYEATKELIKRRYRIYRSRKIRSAVDGHDTRTVDNIVQSVKKRRRDRNDAS